ncbi:MAG: tetratricopeptide (TPR) repeat protein [Chlamydiales bacterium]|jgi:tetratricopeptide (TPR) repeat protein
MLSARMAIQLRLLPLALAFGLAASGCGAPEKVVESPRDSEYGRLELSARAAFERGELEYARNLYGRQLLQAERSDDALKIGDSAYNLAVCEIALGGTDRARGLLSTALFELGRAGERLAPVHVVRARLEHLAGESDACLQAADRALQSSSGATRREQIEALALRGLALIAGDAPVPGERRSAAGVALERAEKLAKKLGGRDSMPSSALRLRARLAQHDRQFANAARAYEREAEVLQARSRYDFMSEALELAGRAWLAAGEPARAGDRLLRAARSRFAHAQGREVPARRALVHLEDAARLCHLVSESGALDADPALAPRQQILVARIEVERERAQGVLDMLGAPAASE